MLGVVRAGCREIFRGRSGFLLLTLLAYFLIGGFIFQAIEYDDRAGVVKDQMGELENEREALLKSLWIESVSRTADDWAEIADERMDEYEDELRESIENGVDGEDDNPWSLVGSIFYAFTVCTTIGYGNVYPVSTVGRLVTIFYGFIGIPLTLIYLNEIGKSLTMALKMLIRQWFGCTATESDEPSSFDFTPLIATAVTLSYLLFGAILLDFLEDDWSILDAFYFTFISFSTVGFGDLVPSKQGWMLLFILYSLSALSLVAACFTVIQSSLDNQITAKQSQFQDWCSLKSEAFADWQERRRLAREAAVARKNEERLAAAEAEAETAAVKEDAEAEEATAAAAVKLKSMEVDNGDVPSRTSKDPDVAQATQKYSTSKQQRRSADEKDPKNKVTTTKEAESEEADALIEDSFTFIPVGGVPGSNPPTGDEVGGQGENLSVYIAKDEEQQPEAEEVDVDDTAATFSFTADVGIGEDAAGEEMGENGEVAPRRGSVLVVQKEEQEEGEEDENTTTATFSFNPVSTELDEDEIIEDADDVEEEDEEDEAN